MKVERGPCMKCGKKTVERTGEAADGRPAYQCQDGQCANYYTKGFAGEDWDTQPKKERTP